MPTSPPTFATKLDALSRLLLTARRVVFDFEASDVSPRDSAVVGCGFYDPDAHQAAYINVGHRAIDKRFPEYAPEQLVDTLRLYIENPERHLIAHNSAFDLRWIIKHGGKVRCRVSDSMIRFHRTDENLARYSRAPTRHRHVDISYGLKQLTVVFAGEKPPELFDVTERRNAMEADILPIAQYCVLDCVNTAFLFDFAEQLLNRDKILHQLTDDNDDPSNIVVAEMMWEGIGIDVEEAWQQRGEYERAIQACRNLIWKISGVHLDLDTKREQIRFLRAIGIKNELGYDPFVMPTWSDKDPSLTTDDLSGIFRDLKSQDTRLIVAAIICKSDMQQRINAFCRPLAARASYDRLYLNSFMPLQASTRYSCSPNLQALPKRADKVDNSDPATILPDECREAFSTRNIVRARLGCVLVSFDLKTAEPNYLAVACEKAITEQDSQLHADRAILRELRWAMHPEIMQLHKSLRNKRASYTETDPIVWPEIAHDPLFLAFQAGRDPYHVFIEAMDAEGCAAAVARGEKAKWLEDERWRGKLGFLAPTYGVTAESLAVNLGWTLEQTQQALANLNSSYPMIAALTKLAAKHLVHTGSIRSLWNRPRRINGYFQLAQPNPLIARFVRTKTAAGDDDLVQHYEARIIPVGTYKQGVQAFVERIHCIESGQIVMQCNKETGAVEVLEEDDAYVHAVIDTRPGKGHFNKPPFANIPYSTIQEVEELDTGLIRFLPRQAQGIRMLFNSIFQGSGADHLRWLMIAMDRQVCRRQEFNDCKLILTIHDALLYEVPEIKWRDFIAAAKSVLTKRPPWATLDIGIECEVGERFGSMKKLENY